MLSQPAPGWRRSGIANSPRRRRRRQRRGARCGRKDGALLLSPPLRLRPLPFEVAAAPAAVAAAVPLVRLRPVGWALFPAVAVAPPAVVGGRHGSHWCPLADRRPHRRRYGVPGGVQTVRRRRWPLRAAAATPAAASAQRRQFQANTTPRGSVPWRGRSLRSGPASRPSPTESRTLKVRRIWLRVWQQSCAPRSTMPFARSWPGSRLQVPCMKACQGRIPSQGRRTFLPHPLRPPGRSLPTLLRRPRQPRR
mmetsp:Transcript_121798/g.306466  ORF Transcript_121798/g.306466 Transcript_121798/m.306466 type:complete len:251 (+) Transcript_121798:450-1202(+)